ncbi:uncharacterized protein BYT42DRAFT_567338 [Radiomyces spectabilis]|uniref:uncharacterized protein n=1 Tax=Radiomyces spectabilis TaxID=64574 RepID=UPI00221F9A69|nr:uncharacterized protein BYT42DRAFT_567338 [Radiomyces spectabilis]KAI8379071.1 hypothetical protein BYT42DRAFT_567338 [Radiomyces spectabilis]
MTNTTFQQPQRFTPRPAAKDVAFFDEDDFDDDEEVDSFITDFTNGTIDSLDAHRTDDTLTLARFLANTGPEEFSKNGKKQNQQLKRASRLLNRLRKRPSTKSSLTSSATLLNTSIAGAPKKTHIPLPVYTPPSLTSTESSEENSQSEPQPRPVQRPNSRITATSTLRDSGVYSEVSDKDSVAPPVPPFPSTTAASVNELHFPVPPSLPLKSQARSQPRRPAPLPASVASAAIAAACRNSAASFDYEPRTLSICSNLSDKSVLRSVPAAALKRRSVRIRHAQVQTQTATGQHQPPSSGAASSPETDRRACPHCHQVISPSVPLTATEPRRLSCPPVLASGKLLKAVTDKLNESTMTDEAKMLLGMIEQLKMQLAEEQQSRMILEKAIMSRQMEGTHKMDQVAREKDRWKGDCLWLSDRIALLPE